MSGQMRNTQVGAGAHYVSGNGDKLLRCCAAIVLTPEGFESKEDGEAARWPVDLLVHGPDGRTALRRACKFESSDYGRAARIAGSWHYREGCGGWTGTE